MNDGVAMLLERMKTNPEEFLGERDGKWENLVYRFHEYLDPQDHATFKQELNKLMQQRFTEKVLEELVDPKKLSGGHNDINPLNAMASGGVTLGQSTGLFPHNFTPISNSLTLGNTTINEETLKHIINAQKPATLFGRLFNYQ